MVRMHGVPRVIYSDTGSQFIDESWRELQWRTRTKLAYNITYHPQRQGVVECMNSVIEQCMSCIIDESGNMHHWRKLSTVELVINSLPNKSAGFSPFYLNEGKELILPL